MGSLDHDEHDNRDGSTTELLGGLVSDAKDLVVAHADRAKIEVRQELDTLNHTIKLTGIALGAVVVAGLLATQALTLGLVAATGMPTWAASAIMAVVAGVVGYAVYKRRPPAAQRDLVPENAIADAQEDVERLANAVSGD